MFLQIDNKAINVDHITYVVFVPRGNIAGHNVRIHLFGSDIPFDLFGEEADMFERWWEEQAEVYRAI